MTKCLVCVFLSVEYATRYLHPTNSNENENFAENRSRPSLLNPHRTSRRTFLSRFNEYLHPSSVDALIRERPLNSIGETSSHHQQNDATTNRSSHLLKKRLYWSEEKQTLHLFFFFFFIYLWQIKSNNNVRIRFNWITFVVRRELFSFDIYHDVKQMIIIISIWVVLFLVRVDIHRWIIRRHFIIDSSCR